MLEALPEEEILDTSLAYARGIEAAKAKGTPSLRGAWYRLCTGNGGKADGGGAELSVHYVAPFPGWECEQPKEWRERGVRRGMRVFHDNPPGYLNGLHWAGARGFGTGATEGEGYELAVEVLEELLKVRGQEVA